MELLYEKLKKYSVSDAYPFHMPGHKRRFGEMINPYQIDITEITGFDDLHHAEGIIKECEEKAAALYGAEETHFLVNGSTGGILSAISGSVKRGGKIAVARNSHKSVYHGILLNDLEAFYLYPEYIEEYGINGGISPEAVEKLLEQEKDIEAVMITSPTYEGIVSDVEKIAKIVHSRNIPLIVDEAHGAHLYFHEKFPKGALQCGADVVINSVHKTLPALTQTALLHINGEFADRERIRKYLAIYQSSSPSYVLMAGISQCMELMEREGKRLLGELHQKLEEFYLINKKLKNIQIVTNNIKNQNSVYDFDNSKLVISVKDTDITGGELQEILTEQFQIELEMSSLTYALAMTSVGDSKEGMERLAQALLELDEKVNRKSRNLHTLNTRRISQVIHKITKAELMETVPVPLEASGGKISGEFVYVYPPGIPVLCPGELVTEEIQSLFIEYKKAGIHLRGMEDSRAEMLKVLKGNKTN